MLKKIMLTVVMLGVTGILVFGAVNRTIAKTSDVRTENSTGGGRGQNGEVEAAVRNQSVESGKGTNGEPLLLQRNLSSERAVGEGRNGNTSIERPNSPDPQANPGEWVTFEGVVSALDSAVLVVELTDGTQIEVEGRAWAFALEVSFLTELGNVVQVQGFYEDGEFKPASITDLTSGEWVILREMDGRPAWAGNGWGGGRQE